METKNVSNLKIHKLTQAQYDRELAAGNIDEYALYLTPDEEIDLSPYATVEQVNGKANATHDHAISDVRDLQTALDGKAASSHGTHVSYSTTSPMMDGTASVGTASTVARSDHKHPTDTSRAAKTDLDSHTSNTTVHITSEERTNWNAAKTHAGSAHAPSNAEKNQNAFSNITVGSTTIAADSATDTLILEGSNVTITPDATNDKVTIGITKDNVTGALGYTPMDKANPTGTGAVSINRKADTDVYEYSVAMGYDCTASGYAAVALGSTATASGHQCASIGCETEATAFGSIALGYSTKATAASAFAVGESNEASGSCSSAIGSHNIASGSCSAAINFATTASGDYSTAMGSNSKAIGEYSVAMGYDCTAEGIGSLAMGSTSTCGPDAEYSAALGESNTVTGSNSFSSGYGNTVSGGWSAVFGSTNDVKDSASSSLVAGYGNTVSGGWSAVFGESNNMSAGYGLIAGYDNTVDGTSGVTLGQGCTAKYYALAQGLNTTAAGARSVAFNDKTRASGNNSAAFGTATTALRGQFACGAYNDTSAATAGYMGGTGSGTAFVIGNGAKTYNDEVGEEIVGSNAFRVDYNGAAYGKSAYTTNGCDYAEYFEWKDSNPENEDRRGYFVTLDGEKIKIAEPGDYILGIISGHPAVIGNGDESWMGRYILDDFGDFIYEDFEYEVQEPEDVVNEETGEVTIQTKTVKKTGKKYKENPDYDPSVIYIQRADRPEWDAVGMIGVLSVRDDGTCQVNGYCKVAAGGTATAAESGYRVVKRVNDSIIKVIFK